MKIILSAEENFNVIFKYWIPHSRILAASKRVSWDYEEVVKSRYQNAGLSVSSVECGLENLDNYDVVLLSSDSAAYCWKYEISNFLDELRQFKGLVIVIGRAASCFASEMYEPEELGIDYSFGGDGFEKGLGYYDKPILVDYSGLYDEMLEATGRDFCIFQGDSYIYIDTETSNIETHNLYTLQTMDKESAIYNACPDYYKAHRSREECIEYMKNSVKEAAEEKANRESNSYSDEQLYAMCPSFYRNNHSMEDCVAYMRSIF